MAWIKVISEGEATGRLQELYAKLVEPWGGGCFGNILGDGLV